MFASGVIPGIITTLLCIGIVVFQVKRNPSMAPSADKYSMKEKVASLKGIWGVITLFAIIIGGIFVGIFTPNEGAAIGCFLSLVFMAVTKNLNRKNLVSSVERTAKSVGMTFLILMGATVFGQFMGITRVPQSLANWAVNLDVSRYVILSVILLIYVFLGMIMDTLAMLLITVPSFAPLISALGFDLIWFGVLLILVSMLGLITPPVGLNCYVIAGVAKGVPLHIIFKGALPYSLAILVVILLVIIFPPLATWLPSLVV